MVEDTKSSAVPMYHVIYSVDSMWVIHFSGNSFDGAAMAWVEAMKYSSTAKIVKDVPITICEAL